MTKIFGLLFILLVSLSTEAQLTNVQKADVVTKNLLQNPGFELGKTKWTASAGTFATTTSSPMVGAAHATWDAAASADTLTSAAVAIPVGLYGEASAASCKFVTASGTATHTIQAYDGTNILTSVTITSSATVTRSTANFIMPSSGNIQLRIYANANEPSVAIDDCYLGPAHGFNVGSVSQAQLAGESYFVGTANCTGWTRTNTAFGSFATDADCPGPTVARSSIGSWQTTDSDLPRQTINNLPPGIYKATFITSSLYASGIVNAGVTIYDGTSTCSTGQNSINANTGVGLTVSCTFEYSTSGNRSFELYVASGSGSITLDNSNAAPTRGTKFILEYFPNTQQTAFTPDKLANSWTGYHANNCQWTTTSLTPEYPTGDATCTFTQWTNMNMGTVSSDTDGTGPRPGIKFTPAIAGTYRICARTIQYTSGTSSQQAQLYSGTTVLDDTMNVATTNGRVELNVCGNLVATSTAQQTITLRYAVGSAVTLTVNANLNDVPPVRWEITNISQSFPMPNLVNGEYVSGGTITIGATTTPPTKGTVVTDNVSYHRRGAVGYFRYRFQQTAVGGAAGSGTYLVSLPAGLSFASSVSTTGSTVPTVDGPTTAKDLAGMANFRDSTSGPTAARNFVIVPYNSTQFYVELAQIGGTSFYRWGSAGFPFSNAIAFVIEFEVPINGWN